MNSDAENQYLDVAIVIPVFNEAGMIAEVVAEVRKTFANVICIDDGSIDDSGRIAKEAGAKTYFHPMNLGQGAALQTGIEAAISNSEIKYLVTFDADGQHSVADAMAMVKRLREGDVEVVFGSRFLDERTEIGTLKKLVLKVAVFYTNALSGVKLTDAHNGLRAFTRNVAESIELTHNGMAHATEIVKSYPHYFNSRIQKVLERDEAGTGCHARCQFAPTNQLRAGLSIRDKLWRVTRRRG